MDKAQQYAAWNGMESLHDYARNVGLEDKKTLDLGNGNKLEMVLIPAADFELGVAAPPPPQKSFLASNAALFASGILLSISLMVLARKSVRTRKVSYSLAWLLSFTMVVGLLVGCIISQKNDREQILRYERELDDYRLLPENEKHMIHSKITQPFYIGIFTITQQQYRAVMRGNPSAFKGPDLPVENVSWFDANIFCAELNKLLNDQSVVVKLPSEQQWEFACRGGQGKGSQDDLSWNEKNSNGRTHPCGTKTPNGFGLYDMNGNVWQWCEDSYVENLRATEALDADQGIRVLRGGSFIGTKRNCRSTIRLGCPDALRAHDVGFRVVANLNNH